MSVLGLVERLNRRNDLHHSANGHSMILIGLPQHVANREHDTVVLIREVAPDDWQLLRDIRLTALLEAPSAFGSSYEREAGFAEADWRERIETGAVNFLAFLPEVSPAGLAGSFEDRPGVAELVAMWVAPAARGRGTGEALIDAVVNWAKSRDYRELHLWVTEGNVHARGLYERCGFVPTGERQPLPSNPSLPEIGMRLPI